MVDRHEMVAIVGLKRLDHQRPASNAGGETGGECRKNATAGAGSKHGRASPFTGADARPPRSVLRTAGAARVASILAPVAPVAVQIPHVTAAVAGLTVGSDAAA